MKTLPVQLTTLALGAAFCATAIAGSMPKSDYKAAKAAISAEYKVSKAACDALSANAKDVCVAEAKGQRNVARARLEDDYSHTPKAEYKALLAQSSAAYAVSREKCDELSGAAKKTCIKDAKRARDDAITAAKKKTHMENYTLKKDE